MIVGTPVPHRTCNSERRPKKRGKGKQLHFSPARTANTAEPTRFDPGEAGLGPAEHGTEAENGRACRVDGVTGETHGMKVPEERGVVPSIVANRLA